MTTSLGPASELDAGVVDDLFCGDVLGRLEAAAEALPPPGRPAPAGVTPSARRAVDSMPPSAALARQLARAVLTSAPLVASDLASLSLCGLATESLLGLLSGSPS